MNTAPVEPLAKRRHGLRVLQILVTVGLAAALLWIVDWPSVLDAFRHIRPQWTVLVVVLVFVERTILNIKWHTLLATGGVRIGFGKLFRIQLAASALGTFLPSSIGVDAFRIAGLWRYQDRRHEIVAATLLDRMTTVLATLFVSAAMVVLTAGTLVGRQAVIEIAVGGLVAVLAGVFFLTPAGRRLVKGMIRWLPGRMQERLMQIGAAGLLIAGHPRSIVVTVVTSLMAVALRVVIGKCLLLACGFNVPLSTLAFVLPVVWGTTMLPISIGGIGVQDATYVLLLGYAGIGSAVAIIVSLLDHVLSRTPLILGVLFWRDVIPVSHIAERKV